MSQEKFEGTKRGNQKS